MENTILIYSEKNSPRLKYIFNIIFSDVFGISYSITFDKSEYENYPQAKLNYSNFDFEKEELKITPFSLLFEFGIKDHLIEVHAHPLWHFTFFKNSGKQIPFDLFSAAFWLISRYEEYLPFKPDSYNRFDVKNSLAYQHGFIHLPLVNLWLLELKNILSKKYPELKFKSRSFNFISTIDVDNAYKYKHKGLMRTLGGYLKSIYSFDKKELNERTKVLFNKKKDPFDSYDFLLSVQKKYNTKLLFFFLLGDYGINDKNHPANEKKFQDLIKHIADYCDTGIHPSFKSNKNLNQLKTEVNRLSNITHRTIDKSRQHFSMLSFPYTYQSLSQAGILNDYSMGYIKHNGFRASFCLPFNWYDLDSEQETNLLIHSFSISETALKYTHNISPGNVFPVIEPMIKLVKKCQGELISVFHNDTMGDSEKWMGWQEVFEQLSIKTVSLSSL